MSKVNFKDYQLGDEIVKALNHLGYDHLTDVQQQVIPLALEKKDLTVKSRTGSGKTAAFGVPICEMIEWRENKPQALILTPTRELADQVKEDIAYIGRFKRIKATAVYGKEPYARQIAELKQKCHVVVGTPGRVLEHLESGMLAIERIECLVIDEADEMLKMGFIDEVEAIIHKLPQNRMTMLFSATLPKDVERLSKDYMVDPTNIEILGQELENTQINHSLYRVGENEKFKLLQDITVVKNPERCMIFCRTKDQVDQLASQLDRLGYSCNKIHGSMLQEDRFAVMNNFKRGEFRYLVATDVAARGIDIDNITHVINYDLPLENESYVHRTGRTGRAGKTGNAITFVTPYEDRFLASIESYIGFTIPEKNAPSNTAVMKATDDFNQKLNVLPKLKEIKGEQLDKDIMKLYFNGGKKKKIRAVDFVGTIAKLKGITAEDIGIITIKDNVSYVDILNGKGQLVIDLMEKVTVKGKKLRVEQAQA